MTKFFSDIAILTGAIWLWNAEENEMKVFTSFAFYTKLQLVILSVYLEKTELPTIKNVSLYTSLRTLC